MYLRQAGLTRNPTFSYLYCVRCRGHHAASEAPLERKYSRWAQGGTSFKMSECLSGESGFRITANLKNKINVTET